MAISFANRRMSDYQKLTVEKALLEKRYPTFRGNHIDRRTDTLTCVGSIQPTPHSDTYQLKLIYPVWGIPKMYVVTPQIEPSPTIHIYQQGHLCLYHPIETPWRDTHHLSDTIIPWTAEWLVFYELYKLYGIWLGKSYSHESTTTK